MRLGEIADSLLERVETATERAGAWFEPSLRIGVTGLSGAGKTVFITALAASLLHRGRLAGFAPEAEGRILSAGLGSQPDPALPRFAYERHLEALTAVPPRWPESTRSVSQLRISLRHRPAGILGGIGAGGVLHVDIVDYPGEWLVDLPLLEIDYDAWAEAALAAARSPARRAHAAGWLKALASADPAAEHHEPAAEALAAAFSDYLARCRRAGLAALAPGRFLLPGDLAGSPALTFAPLPAPEAPRKTSLHAEMRRRFEAYKRVVVKPFFQDHFARIDRQVVLIDALGALAHGPRAFGDLMESLEGTLAAFRHGRAGWIERLLGGRRIDRLLIAASKADHLHHSAHGALTRLVEAMVSEAAGRAAYRGAELRGVALAAIRATVEHEASAGGRPLAMVRGRRADTGREIAVHAGSLPDDPAALIAAAADPGTAAADWPDAAFAQIPFAPPRWSTDAGKGPPHIRLDKALDFLIGDRME
ncbi:YcjX family protein [Paralimibaculum aggregatum]|uniref:YcjX family protein n=1 Tax=Paralimibaculum aggregatum TaxID=3036245 RepID=A0ABQ6LKT6_9RHOB|nr:YcjX family protein [Limibaculum sp. NKW23]GMG83021.1 YcjX family protein [Limibaculum sp. NKW23]